MHTPPDTRNTASSFAVLVGQTKNALAIAEQFDADGKVPPGFKLGYAFPEGHYLVPGFDVTIVYPSGHTGNISEYYYIATIKSSKMGNILFRAVMFRRWNPNRTSDPALNSISRRCILKNG